MSHLAKHSNYIDTLKQLTYSDGSFVQLGDHVIYKNKTGVIVNFDRQTVNIKFDDGTEQSFIDPIWVQKVICMKHFAKIQKEFLKHI